MGYAFHNQFPYATTGFFFRKAFPFVGEKGLCEGYPDPVPSDETPAYVFRAGKGHRDDRNSTFHREHSNSRFRGTKPAVLAPRALGEEQNRFTTPEHL